MISCIPHILDSGLKIAVVRLITHPKARLLREGEIVRYSCKPVLSIIVVVLLSSAAQGAPPYLNAWEQRYPESTLPLRMAVQVGSACNLCHVPPAFGTEGNCYRADLIVLLDGGATIEEAIEQLDTVDSDGDGVANGVEILLPHADFPGDVGYNMGLVGADGVNPCGTDPLEPVSGVAETPPGAVPTLSEWALLLTAALLGSCGAVVIRKRRSAVAVT